MPRKPRLTHPGYYHVLSRGVERRQVFLEKEDFHYFLTLLAHIKDQFSITVHAFCLMDNHYHVLVQTYRENISEAMQYLNANYSARFNRKYKRSGHLWQGRYKSYLLFDASLERKGLLIWYQINMCDNSYRICITSNQVIIFISY
jgi:REP element-mobilizing transposase RayT